MADPKNFNKMKTDFNTDNFSERQRNWFRQLQWLLWRSSRNLKSGLKGYFSQLVYSTLISAMILSVCYTGITGTTQRGVQDIRGFLWLVCSEISFNMSYSALYIFEGKVKLFMREVGVYSTSAYFVTVFLCIIPLCIAWPTAFITVVSATIPLPNHLVTTVELLIVLIILAIASAAYGLGMGVLFAASSALGDIMPCADLPLFVMSGAFLRLSSLPFWLHPIKYISHFYYGMDAMSNIYWRQIDFIECPSNSTSTCYKNGMSVLTETGYSDNFIPVDSIGLLFITVAWSMIGYIGLKREERKGYAY